MFEVDNAYQVDATEAVRSLPRESTHLFLSDIPYGIGADAWDVLHSNTNSAYLGSSPAQKKAGALFKRRGKPINGWSEADKAIPREYYEWCMTWAPVWLEALKPGGSAIIFAGRRFAHRCISALEDSGFSFKDMLAWERRRAPHRAQRLSAVYDRRKDTFAASKWDGWRLGNLQPTFEPVLWFQKPYRTGGTIADNVLQHEVGAYNQAAFERYNGTAENILAKAQTTEPMGFHPTQKPTRVLESLIDLTTLPGHLVVDPFCGSGSTLVAAKNLGRHYLGFDRDAGYIETTKRRLSDRIL
ncbi:DNA-methyltransferase [Xanthomonas euvesicatoria]|uniref:DNA-methyltransferase n=1 Tax=Xanthomonas euvesicatoria TaxID=456327 RepID=UPI001C460EB9|nr:site-specific DNA-methyltransferase [Xanthomonas euvesicatoria]MBV6777394.1 site-specific DNA-methyltransferase [Xanthomonas campestris pv. carissae]